jgi:two-component system, sensor histidine kinase and response regulator
MPADSAPTVLIVDDNAQNLQVLANILRERRFRVATARDGFRALDFLRKRTPDLILLDIMMPGMDGFEVCRRLKSDKASKDIPVLFISALSETGDKLKGFEAGALDYITKPFQKEEVFARVNAHLNLKRAREATQAANKALKKANATKDKLFSIISHDLRSPLGGLLNSLELLTEKWEALPDETKREILTDLRGSVKSAYDLMENMLCWANAQRGKIDFHPENTPLRQIVDNNLRVLSGVAREKSIRIETDIDPQLLVYADPNMAMSVLRNLISNAVKFTPEGGRIDVTAEEGEAEAAVSVADTGVGVGRDRLPRLFQLDAHFTTPGTRNEKGSGLGLLLCREFVERNGGRIWAADRSGGGTVFTFTLPTYRDPETPR